MPSSSDLVLPLWPALPNSMHNSETKQPPTRVRYLMLTGLCLAASVAYLCRNSLGVAESTIREELGLSEVGMSWVMSSFFLVYALAQIPTGWMGSRWGSRRAIPAFAIAWSLATAAMSFAVGMPILLGSRICNGLAQAGLFPACTSTIRTWFPATRRAFSSGALASFMSIGGAIGVAITGALVVQIGWRATFLGYGGVGVVFALGFYALFRDTPLQHRWVNNTERELIGLRETLQDRTEPTDWQSIYLSPATWWICGQQFCRAAGEIFFSSWFATYLQETRDVSVQTSGILNSLPLVGIVTGALIGGAVSDYVLVRTGKIRLARSGVAVASMLLCATFVFTAYFIEDPWLAVFTISLGSFCASLAGHALTRSRSIWGAGTRPSYLPQ